jgi:hypothetical protein
MLRGMGKRNLATVLWFLAGWSFGGLFAGIMGMPSMLAFVPALLLAGLVRWDPTGVLWTRQVTTTRRVRPINEVAEELDRKAGAPVAPLAAIEGDRTSR